MADRTYYRLALPGTLDPESLRVAATAFTDGPWDHARVTRLLARFRPDQPLWINVPERPVGECREAADAVLGALRDMGVGVAAWRLGAGRSRPGEAVQAAAGVEILAHIGDEVRAGDVIARLHTDTPERVGRAQEAIDGSWTLADSGTAVPERRIVKDRIA